MLENRDVFGAPGNAAAAEALKTCEAALEKYANRVYTEEAEGR